MTSILTSSADRFGGCDIGLAALYSQKDPVLPLFPPPGMAALTPPTERSFTPPLFLGIDVGGTNTKLGVVDNAGRVAGKFHLETEEQRGPVDAVARIKKAADALLARLSLNSGDLAAVGLATPGTQDLKTGTLLHPHNLPHWFDFPIRQAVARCPRARANPRPQMRRVLPLWHSLLRTYA